jgi:hypothetical protein
VLSTGEEMKWKNMSLGKSYSKMGSNTEWLFLPHVETCNEFPLVQTS